ncbi:unnamed protein product, partial [Linum tenue]
ISTATIVFFPRSRSATKVDSSESGLSFLVLQFGGYLQPLPDHLHEIEKSGGESFVCGGAALLQGQSSV